MKADKPLYVQVAEALGWTDYEKTNTVIPGYAVPPESFKVVPPGLDTPYAQRPHVWLVPRYDTDWSATGPLIEEHGFWLRSLDGSIAAWDAFRNDDLSSPRGTGSTPLLAVCNLILALSKAGKLAA